MLAAKCIAELLGIGERAGIIGGDEGLRNKRKIGGKSLSDLAAADDSPAKSTAPGSFVPRFIHEMRILSLWIINNASMHAVCKRQKNGKKFVS